MNSDVDKTPDKNKNVITILVIIGVVVLFLFIFDFLICSNVQNTSDEIDNINDSLDNLSNSFTVKDLNVTDKLFVGTKDIGQTVAYITTTTANTSVGNNLYSKAIYGDTIYANNKDVGKTLNNITNNGTSTTISNSLYTETLYVSQKDVGKTLTNITSDTNTTTIKGNLATESISNNNFYGNNIYSGTKNISQDTANITNDGTTTNVTNILNCDNVVSKGRNISNATANIINDGTTTSVSNNLYSSNILNDNFYGNNIYSGSKNISQDTSNITNDGSNTTITNILNCDNIVSRGGNISNATANIYNDGSTTTVTNVFNSNNIVTNGKNVGQTINNINNDGNNTSINNILVADKELLVNYSQYNESIPYINVAEQFKNLNDYIYNSNFTALNNLILDGYIKPGEGSDKGLKFDNSNITETDGSLNINTGGNVNIKTGALRLNYDDVPTRVFSVGGNGIITGDLATNSVTVTEGNFVNLRSNGDFITPLVRFTLDNFRLGDSIQTQQSYVKTSNLLFSYTYPPGRWLICVVIYDFSIGNKNGISLNFYVSDENGTVYSDGLIWNGAGSINKQIFGYFILTTSCKIEVKSSINPTNGGTVDVQAIRIG